MTTTAMVFNIIVLDISACLLGCWFIMFLYNSVTDLHTYCEMGEGMNCVFQASTVRW